MPACIILMNGQQELLNYIVPVYIYHYHYILMADAFVITATYKNQEKDFDAELIAFGYSYRIEVMVDDVKVIFEPDEEKNYRAYIPDEANAEILPNHLLLQAIAEALEKAFK
jgi:hypothetical protein